MLSDHIGHPQPSLSGTGVLWVSTGTRRCVDPPRQGGGSTAPTLWLLLCCCIALSCVHGCACDHIEHAAHKDPSLGRMHALWISADLACNCVAPYTFNLNLLQKEIFTLSTLSPVLHALRLTIINDFAHLFIVRYCSRNCNLCAHQHTSRAGRNCCLQRSTIRSLVFGVVSPLASTILSRMARSGE